MILLPNKTIASGLTGFAPKPSSATEPVISKRGNSLRLSGRSTVILRFRNDETEIALNYADATSE